MSQGNASDAFNGSGGRLDIEAAVSFLTRDQSPCPIDSSKIVVIGASNGTTSALDYAIDRNTAMPHLAAMVWLSPGAYTENQRKVTENWATLEALPILMIHAAKEPWAAQWVPVAPKAWSFVKIQPGSHGTKLFDLAKMESKTMKALLPFVRRYAAPE